MVVPCFITFRTRLSGAGDQPVGEPVLSSNWARRCRDCPPIVVKLPPAYALFPLMHNDLTSPLALGSHKVAAPVVISMAPSRLRVCPARVVKVPPKYKILPAICIVYAKSLAP